ncbi:kinase-like domain-containing protein [Rhizophagus diaphanus]|nr:kinase-like domain-containing protein [Rhizophagus diaphanus] [Rhizophagus sp. MUCL 43196]
MSNKWNMFVQCFGLTQDPLDGNYMLVINKMDIDLREYLRQHHDQLTWKKRVEIVFYIISALSKIHKENIIHRDLHSGNILYTTRFSICDLGFSGPADKPLGSVYGYLPYIAPEVICGKQTTKASDIYSVAMLMWEISSGRPPFTDCCEHDNELVMKIINGIRPKIVPGTPLEYEELMKQCWDADPSKRPDTYMLWDKIYKINASYQNKNELDKMDESIMRPAISEYLKNHVSKSKVHQFENLPEPRNATEEELEAFHSKPYDFDIPNNIEDFGKSVNQKDNVTKVLENSKKYPFKVFNKLQISSKIDNVRNDYFREEIIQRQRKNVHINDDDEMHYNSNLHSEEQNKLELPDDI